MSEMKRATETFAWEGGLVHWGTEVPADSEVVKRFGNAFFEDVEADGEPAPAPRKLGRPKKAAPNG